MFHLKYQTLELDHGLSQVEKEIRRHMKYGSFLQSYAHSAYDDVNSNGDSFLWVLLSVFESHDQAHSCLKSIRLREIGTPD